MTPERYYFYPRSPCGERRSGKLSLSDIRIFLSTLSLRRATIFAVRPYDAPIFLSTLSLRRATPGKVKVVEPGFVFLSTLSLRRATLQLKPPIQAHRQFLSTLSLRRATNRDLRRHSGNDDFYPRSPCGERPARSKKIGRLLVISIHALLAESDS